jgi:hypothetical protein
MQYHGLEEKIGFGLSPVCDRRIQSNLFFKAPPQTQKEIQINYSKNGGGAGT